MASTTKDSPANRRRLLAYIGEVRAALRMQNWDVVLHEEVCGDEDAHAETWASDNHAVLNIRLEKDFFDLEPRGIRNTIVHELIHAQHRDVTLWWEGCTTGNEDIAVSASKSWDSDFRMYMERFVSWITDRIEGTVPMWEPMAPIPKTFEPGLWLRDRKS